MCTGRLPKEKTEEVRQVVFVAYFPKQNINLKREKWVSCAKVKLLIKTMLPAAQHFSFEMRFTKANLQQTKIHDYHLHFTEEDEISSL